VYDDSADGALGAAWKWGAKAAAIGGASYAIPSSNNTEQTLHDLLSIYAEKASEITLNCPIFVGWSSLVTILVNQVTGSGTKGSPRPRSACIGA
jgi:hypothetical protein